MPRYVRHPAALPAIGLAAGISAGLLFRIAVPFSALAFIWLAALSAIMVQRGVAGIALLLAGFVAAGATLGARADTNSRNSVLAAVFEREVEAGQYQVFGIVTGRLRTDAAKGPTGVSLAVDVESLSIDGLEHPAAGGALVGVGGELTSDQILQWRAGRRVRFPATLRKPSTYLNPGVPDAVRQYAWRGTSLVGSIKSDRLVEVLERGGVLAEALATTRARVREALTRSVGGWSERSAAIATAILIGDRAGLSEDVERRLQEAGTYHVIAISGGNIAILAAIVIGSLQLVRVGPTMSGILAIVALSAYAMVVEGGSSVARATLMAVIYLAVRIPDLDSRAANVAALTAAILFCIRPLDISDAGFALTFGATLGIIVGMSRLGVATRLPPWARPAAALLAASLCAEIALLPVGPFVFSRVTFAGLIANFAAIPLMTIVQVGSMASLALAWAPEAALRAGWVVHQAADALVGSAAIVDLAPWLTWRLAPPPAWVVAGYYVALVAALASRRRAVATLPLAFACWIVFAPSARTSDGRLQVTFLDVGQGDAAIVRFPDGRTLAVDAGGLQGGTFDIGGRVVSPAYWALGVRQLDYLAITHGDADHVGGAASVYRDFVPFEVWEGVPVPPHRPLQHLRAQAKLRATAWRTLQPDEKVSIGGVDVIVRHPPHPDWERQRVRNNDSVVIELRYGGVSFVLTGDIGREVEREIAASFERAPVRVLKVPHHGSATSSSELFLNALRPDVAIVSAGRGNTFGHPVPGVLERYRKAGSAIYRTDQDGAVVIETDGETMTLRTFTDRRLTLRTAGR